MRHTCATLVAAGVLMLSATATEIERPGDRAVTPIVSTAWLAAHLDDPSIVVLATGIGRTGADEARIPGARYVPHEALISSHGAGGHDLPPVGDLVAALEAAGVSSGSHVVVYGEPMTAAWLYFALDYLGHEPLSWLDGGLAAWRAEGRPVSRDAPPVARGRFLPRVRAQVRADAGYVRERLHLKATVLLDARTVAEYDAGHIPGARLLPWTALFAGDDPPRLKDREALLGLFSAAGVAPGDAVVTYCRIGMRSSVLHLVARALGFDSRNYPGSFTDWEGRAGFPINRNTSAPPR